MTTVVNIMPKSPSAMTKARAIGPAGVTSPKPIVISVTKLK